MTFVPEKEYSRILRVLPLLCVDVVLRNARGEYLVVKRKDEPKKGHWWPVGGRILKGEPMEKAARRKIKQEAGIDVSTARPVGYYELTSAKNRFGVKGHSVSVVFFANVPAGAKVRLDATSSDWKFVKKLPNDFRVRNFGEMN